MNESLRNVAIELNICEPGTPCFDALCIILFGVSNKTVDLYKIHRGVGLSNRTIRPIIDRLRKGGFVRSYQWQFEYSPINIVELTIAALCGSGEIVSHEPQVI